MSARRVNQRRKEAAMGSEGAMGAQVADDSSSSTTTNLARLLAQLDPRAARVDLDAIVDDASTENEEQAAQQRLQEYRRTAAELLEKEGERGVQDALRASIARTKKAESEIANTKKRVESVLRERETLQLNIAKVARAKLDQEDVCKTLLHDTEKLREQAAERIAAEKKNRDEVKEKIEKDIEDIGKKIEEQRVELEATEKDNVALRARFSELKGAFDTSVAQYETTWKAMDAETRDIVDKVRQKMQANDLLQAQVLMKEQTLKHITEAITSYKGQLELYESKFGDFESAVKQSSTVFDVADAQRKLLTDRVAELEAQKARDVEEKQATDAETNKLRGQLREFKKAQSALEKAKLAAEVKCRQLQDNWKKKAARAKAKTGDVTTATDESSSSDRKGEQPPNAEAQAPTTTEADAA